MGHKIYGRLERASRECLIAFVDIKIPRLFLGIFLFDLDVFLSQRWGQPAQQHGRRIPWRILSRPTAIRWVLVSSFLAEVTQQIHSLRASGVISVQTLFTIESESMAFLKSAGRVCTGPAGVSFLVISNNVKI